MPKITYRVANDGQRHRFAQNFDKEKIFITKAGKTFNVYDSIQAANVDTDIYKTLEKYGSIEPMYRKNVEEIAQEFTEFLSLRDVQEKNIKAQNMWNNLSAGVREEFKNNIYEFMQNGEKWIKEQQKIAAETQAKTLAENKKADAKILADAIKEGAK